MKVLIIDDEPLVRRSLSRVLKTKNYQVIEAAEGLSGLEMWKKEKPDLIFLDVLMPGLTGLQVLEELGQERSGKVVLMSAYTGATQAGDNFKSQVDLFLSKPFDDIFAIIQKAEELL